VPNASFSCRSPLIELKARLLCEGANVDEAASELFELQNPSKAKRGGLSSGGKIKLAGGLFANFPVYQKRKTRLSVVRDSDNERGVFVQEGGQILASGEVLPPPAWYGQNVGDFEITRIFTAHNRQLATAIYEDCALFSTGEQCRFCVINRSLSEKPPALVKKSAELVLAALDRIPSESYDGLTMNGGMTFGSGRGMEILVPVIKAIRQRYPSLPIAVEMTPPSDLTWIDRITDAGVSSLMMNLELWDAELRTRLLPGKDKYCPREQYLRAFERALVLLGPGRVSTCFVVGTESVETLKEGIAAVVRLGVIPSPLAGRYFEDIPDYPFVPDVDWRIFLEVLEFAAQELRKRGLSSTDSAGCVACRMCDLIKDISL